MSTPRTGQPHDLFDIQVLFEEIRGLRKAAKSTLKGLFLNADPGFDPADFVAAYEKEESMANVKENPRDSAKQKSQHYESGTHVFDQDLYQGPSLNTLTPGLTASKPC